MSEDGNIRFIYASTATFGDGQIETPATQRVVFNVVRKSRRNNPGWGVVGTLLFGDGQFLQVLEGKAADVDALFEVIASDDRHRDLKVLLRQAVEKPAFAQWSMKFPTMNEDLRSVLGLGLGDQFRPYQLGGKKLDALTEHLLATEEPAV